jgi:hypothetical protein
MVRAAKSAQLSGSLEWLCEIAETGVMPTNGPVDESHVSQKALGWGGRVENIGVGDRTFDLPIIRPKESVGQLFDLPKELLSDLLARRELLQTVPVFDVKDPNVHYKKRTGKKKITTGNQILPEITSGNQNLPVGKKKSRKKRSLKKRKASESSSSEFDDEDMKEQDRSQSKVHHDSDVDEKLIESDEVGWGSDFSDCVIGVYAAVHSLYVDKFGLAILRVRLPCSLIFECFR